MAMATEHMSLELLQELAMASPRFAILSGQKVSSINKESYRLPTSLLSRFWAMEGRIDFTSLQHRKLIYRRADLVLGPMSSPD